MILGILLSAAKLLGTAKTGAVLANVGAGINIAQGVQGMAQKKPPIQPTDAPVSQQLIQQSMGRRRR